MAFDLNAYLTKHGVHVVPGNLTRDVCTALGYAGLHDDPAQCPEGHVHDMALRLKQRFGTVHPEKTWHARRHAFRGTHLTLPTKLLIELELMQMPLDTFDVHVMHKYADIIGVGNAGEVFVDVLHELECYDPPAQMLPTLAVWLHKLARGEHCTVVMTVCPDYSHENGSYTFHELWDGVGLVAQRALRASVLLHEMARKTSAHLKIVVAIADFEGDSESVCARLGITREEFKARCLRSQQAFRRAAQETSSGIEHVLETPLWSHIVSQHEWSSTLIAACQSVSRGEYSGAFVLRQGDLHGMAKMRHAMYKRWHGEDCNPVEIILRQAPEYGAVGALCMKRFHNALIFGADHVAMSPFLHMLLPALAPVVYMKKADY